MTDASKDELIRELVEALRGMMGAVEGVSGAGVSEAYHKARVALEHAEKLK